MAAVSTVNVQKVDSYLDFVTTVNKFACMGSWSRGRQSSLWVLFDCIYRAVMVFVCVHIAILAFCNFFASWDGNLLGITFNMVTFIIYLTSLVLIVYFSVKQDDVCDLKNYLNNNFYFHSARGLTNMTMWNSYRTARNISIFFVSGGLIGSQHWTIIPLMSYGVNNTRLLPIELWYPVDVQRSPIYELAYLFQFFGQVLVSNCFTSFGIFYMSNCVLICGQLDLLCCSIRNIKFTAMLRSGIPYERLKIFSDDVFGEERGIYFCGGIEYTESYYDYDKKVQDHPRNNSRIPQTKVLDLYDKTLNHATLDALRDCLKFHQMIVKYIRMFEKFSSPMVFFKLLQITAHISVLLYSASNSFEFKLLEYGLLSIIDLYLISYYGHQVNLESSKVLDAAFASQWWSCDPSLSRTLRAFMLSLSGQKALKAVGFYTISLDAFIDVLKASFSYYTLLTNMKK